MAGRQFEKVDWMVREAELCDLLAEGKALPEIAIAMRLSLRVVSARFYKIRKGLGWQGR